jgi:hypothetical protein
MLCLAVTSARWPKRLGSAPAAAPTLRAQSFDVADLMTPYAADSAAGFEPG